MPRKFQFKRPETPEISAKAVLNEIDEGPFKDMAESHLKEFEANTENERTKLAQIVEDGVFATNNMLALIKQKIPKRFLQMNFYSYLEGIQTESTLSVRESFQTRLDDICDFRGTEQSKIKEEHLSNATTGSKKNRLKRTSTANKKKLTATKIKAVATLDGDREIEANSKRRAKAVVASSVPGLRRSLRKGSKPAVKTPAMNSISKSGYKNGFTPKFDPRLPITPAHGLRKPHAGEKIVLMSQAGSPLSTDVTRNCRGPAIILPQMDGKSIAIASDTKLDNFKMDTEMKEGLRVIQQKLSSIVRIPLSKCD